MKRHVRNSQKLLREYPEFSPDQTGNPAKPDILRNLCRS
ncbi:hypothetical protein GMO_09610 [Gluconobacter morbifer G707]|uniref:Uncharacterized protein n=1 Tax=Gluconobacter morbifer G707 TaxID=1088869 RepID=G6XHJ5_9PROT|nr:hypothetical protein GMO_09610 [Gluconobacter morbifer G707]